MKNSPTRSLTQRYVIALSAVALFVAAGQAVIQLQLVSQQRDSRKINLAGRQRMLSQRIAKSSLAAIVAKDPAELQRYVRQLEEDVAVWQAAHVGLLRGDPALGVSGDNSDAVTALFARLAPRYAAIDNAALGLARAATRPNLQASDLVPFVETTLANEGGFVKTMDDIAHAYEMEASGRVASLRRIEFVLLGGTFVVLLLEALFIFRPAVRRLRDTVAELVLARERFETLSETDGLTGIPNRRRFDRTFEREYRRAVRRCAPLCAAVRRCA